MYIYRPTCNVPTMFFCFLFFFFLLFILKGYNRQKEYLFSYLKIYLTSRFNHTSYTLTYHNSLVWKLCFDDNLHGVPFLLVWVRICRTVIAWSELTGPNMEW